MKKGFFLFILIFSMAGNAQEIRNVNFVQEGEVSKLIIESDNEISAERFHVNEDKQIILDLKNVKVSPKLLRGIDTSEFPGSAVYISGYKKPGTKSDIRFAIQLRDNVRSILEKKGKTIVLNIENRFGVFSKKKVKANESISETTLNEGSTSLHVPKSNSIEDILENITLSGPKKYIGKRISINVGSLPIQDAIGMIVEATGFNTIIDDEVLKRPPVTLSLTNVPWDQALDTILNISNLAAKKQSNILMILTQEKFVKEREEKLRENNIKVGLEPLVTRVFLISYANINDLGPIISDYITKDRGSVQKDMRTNSLIVRDTLESIERIKKIVETLDTQTPQVLIEAKIVEALESYTKRIGLENGIRFGYDPFLQNLAPDRGPGFSFNTAPTSTTAGVAGLSLGVYKRLLNLDFNLQLMESESKGRIISTPRIVTQNKKKATIESGDATSFAVTQPIVGGTGQPLTTFERVSADVKLDVTPQVTNDGSISMEIDISKQAFGTRPSTNAPPDITKRDIKTNVLVENGSTLVIGGLYQTTNNEVISGIPFLKDLPLVGWLFRSAYAPETKKNELIIFMTPRIINAEEAGLAERHANQKTNETTDL